MGFVEHVGPMMKLAVSTSYRRQTASPPWDVSAESGFVDNGCVYERVLLSYRAMDGRAEG